MQVLKGIQGCPFERVLLLLPHWGSLGHGQVNSYQILSPLCGDRNVPAMMIMKFLYTARITVVSWRFTILFKHECESQATTPGTTSPTLANSVWVL